MLFFSPPPVSPPNRRGGDDGGGDVGVGALPSSATLLHPLLSYSHLSLPGVGGGGGGAVPHLLLSLIVACRTPTYLSPCSWSTLHHPQHPLIFNCHPSTCLSASSMLLLHPLQSAHLRVVLATTSPALLPPVSPSTRGRGSHTGWADLPPLHCPRHYLTCYTRIPPSVALVRVRHIITCHSPHLSFVLATTPPTTLPPVSLLVCGRHCITYYTPSSLTATHLSVSPPLCCCHCIPSTLPTCVLSSPLPHLSHSHLSLHLSVVATASPATLPHLQLPPICPSLRLFVVASASPPFLLSVRCPRHSIPHIPTCLFTCPWSPLY